MTTGRRGRIPGPVLAPDRPRARDLALLLRHLKDEAALQYTQLSARTGRPGEPGYRGASTLSRAATGQTVPPAATVEAFARAAGRDGEEPGAADARARRALQAHRAAAVEARLRAAAPCAQRRDFEPVRPQRIRTQASLARALVRQRLQAGNPSLTVLQNDTAAAGHGVPRSRVGRILAGTVLPTVTELEALLAALHVPPAAIAPWRTALELVHERAHPTAPNRYWSYGCADDDPAVQAHRDREERDEEIKRLAGVIRPHESYQDYRDRVAAEREGRDDWEELMLEQAAQEAFDDWRRQHRTEDPEPSTGDNAREHHRHDVADLQAALARARPSDGAPHNPPG